MAHGFRGLVCGHWSVTWEDSYWWEHVAEETLHLMMDRKQRVMRGQDPGRIFTGLPPRTYCPQLDPPTNKVPKTAASTKAYSVKSLQWFDQIQTKLRSAHLAGLEDSAKLGTVRPPPPLWLSKPPMLLLPSSLSAWHCPQAHTQGWGSALIFHLRDALNTPRLDSRIP